MLHLIELRNSRLYLHFNPLVFAALLLLSFSLSGCFASPISSYPDLACDVPSGAENDSRVAFFMNLRRSDVPHVNLEIVAVEIFKAGVWFPVSLNSKEIDTKKIGSGQVSLGQAQLNPGIYEKIRLILSPEATIRLGVDRSTVTLSELVVEIPFAEPLNLQNESSEAFFLSWDVEASFGDNTTMEHLVIDLTSAHMSPITANQIYVACPDINTIYGIRSDKKWVNKSYFVGGRPTYIAIDDSSQKLYVLCQDDGDIKVIDLVTNSLIDIIALPMSFRPIFMDVDDDLIYAFVIDDLGNLSKIDLQTGNLIIRKKVGQRPNYVKYFLETKTVAVSSGRDNILYMLDDETLDIKYQVMLSGEPAGILRKDDFIYIAEEQANNITIFDTKLRSKFKSVFVGFAPRRIIDLGNNIYVANSKSGSLSLIRSRNKRVAKEIQLGSTVYEMVASAREQLLYIGKKGKEDCGGSISVVDVTSNKVVNNIEIGSPPLGIAIGQ